MTELIFNDVSNIDIGILLKNEKIDKGEELLKSIIKEDILLITSLSTTSKSCK